MMNTTDHGNLTTGYSNKFARFFALTSAGCLIVIGLAIAAAGFHLLLEEGELTAKVAWPVMIGTVLALGGGYKLYRLKPLANQDGPIAESERMTRLVLVMSMVLGAAIGMAIVIGGGEFGTLSNGPINPVTGIVVTVAYVVLMPIAAIYSHRSADEFVRGVYAQDAMLALYVYSVITPGWWMLSRAGVIPAQDPMIVFMIVIAVWGVSWITRKAR